MTALHEKGYIHQINISVPLHSLFNHLNCQTHWVTCKYHQKQKLFHASTVLNITHYDAGFIRSMEETYGSVWGSVIWLCYYGVTNYWQWLRKKLLTSRQKTITNKSLVFSICHQYLLYVYISMFQAKFNRFCNINTCISWPMYYNH